MDLTTGKMCSWILEMKEPVDVFASWGPREAVSANFKQPVLRRVDLSLVVNFYLNPKLKPSQV